MGSRARNNGQNTTEQSNVQLICLSLIGQLACLILPLKVNLGHDPSRVEMFIECHSKKDENRTPSTVEATNYMHRGREESLSEASSLATSINLHPQMTSTQLLRPFRVRDVLWLKSIMNPSETVAKGIIHSIYPSTQVRGEELWPNWCEVSIEVAVKKDEQEQLGEVVGRCSAKVDRQLRWSMVRPVRRHRNGEAASPTVTIITRKFVVADPTHR
ncbi:hypothetical protein RJ639_015487 [Escallonia herrerae]|uniref:Uncharacterized protein n=1 Tax=Escallonia herrerae TaxID=1293975 RepID=A0AA88VE75_9ASTE|nr:hypothetical protein RJ639_015487 [Escallonia herrerae]